jgi:hypothetical protein
VARALLFFSRDTGRKANLHILYRSFLDDSKDKGQTKLMVSAGFFGNSDDWGSLRLAWNRVLESHGLNYFKSREYYRLEGQFAKFKSAAYPAPTGRQAAQRIREELQATIEKHPGILGVAVAILLEDYRRVLARPDAVGILPPNPYHTALNSIMYETVKLVNGVPGRHKVLFLHDNGPDIHSLVSSYKHFKRKNPRTAKSLAGFGGLDDTDHPELQAADMIANYAMQRGLEALRRNKRDLKTTIGELTKNFVKFGYWEESYILSALTSMRKTRGLPVPLDLQG